MNPQTEEVQAILAYIEEVAPKVPKSVTLIGSGEGSNHKIGLGQKKTKLCLIEVFEDKVLIHFKDEVWGSRVHEAYIWNGEVYFPLPVRPGWGTSPKFVIKKHETV